MLMLLSANRAENTSITNSQTAFQSLDSLVTSLESLRTSSVWKNRSKLTNTRKKIKFKYEQSPSTKKSTDMCTKIKKKPK